MKVVIQFLKFIIYVPVVIAEYALMTLLEIVKQIKKPFQ
jgi:hypothetical protein